jgi:two-component sensor histidine kinase
MVNAIKYTSSWPLAGRLLCAFAATLACFIIQLPLETRSFGDPFAIFLGCAFLVALLFGRMPGGVAVLVSAVLSSLFFEPMGWPHLIRAMDLVQIEAYAVLAAGAVVLADQIRKTLVAVHDANEALLAEDTRKTVRLQEVQHRVANSFSSLDALMRQRAKAASDPNVTGAFEQASELIHTVARLSHRLNMADPSGRVDAREFLGDMCADLRACAPASVSFSCEAECCELPISIAVPLGLVVNELVTNALKYAFRDRETGQIRIALGQDGSHLVLLVEDDGVGMQGKVQGGGMGVPLLNGLAKSLKGKLEVDSGPGGTRAFLIFPVPAPPARPLSGAAGHLH